MQAPTTFGAPALADARARGRIAALAWRRYGTPQRHADYTSAEHGTWRRLLGRTEALVAQHESRLHPAYVEGFRRLVLPWTTIPDLAQVDAALAEFGWRALCVNGYLPPEVYSGLIARGVFPISRDLRSPEHLGFSPTPDLAHDMLGHIPMLVFPEHREFMRRIARATARTRPNVLDRALYDSHRTLGQLRSTRGGSGGRAKKLIAAERRVRAAQSALESAPSPLTRLSRMYLWSVEFGLMGNPQAFQIYGAGLLSAPAEVEALCRGDGRLLEYSSAVTLRDINFSEHQSAYFIARDYSHLNQTLDDLMLEWARLRESQRAGG